MTLRDDHSTNHTPSGPGPGDLGALVRAVADGEASPAHLDALRATLAPADCAALDATVEAERRLRAATARCLCAACPPAPADLRARVLAATAPAQTGARPDALSLRLFRLFRGNWALVAAAAILLTVVAGLLILPTIAPGAGTWPPDDAARASLVSFLGGEHSNCAPLTRYAERKLPIRDRVAAETFVARWTPEPVRVLNAAGDGYRLVGVGPCGVPGGGDSAHMVFAPIAGEGAPISVFLQDATARRPQALPRTLASLGETSDGQVVRVFMHGACLVYVVAPSDADAARIAANLATARQSRVGG